MATEPLPQCTCNVYASDGSGRVIAWRSWSCPLHSSEKVCKCGHRLTHHSYGRKCADCWGCNEFKEERRP